LADRDMQDIRGLSSELQRAYLWVALFLFSRMVSRA
jgi:hypothetical protein